VAADADESDAPFGDKAPRESFGGSTEQLGNLGDGQVPIAPRLYPGGNYAQERDDYVGSYRAATD
jgi:hypothetical protein